MENVMSEFATTSAGVVTTSTLADGSKASFICAVLSERFQTTRLSNLEVKLAAIGSPITPRPMNPTVGLCGMLALCDMTVRVGARHAGTLRMLDDGVSTGRRQKEV